MNDGQRVYPVDIVVMHHAVSDPMENWEDIDVQDWFDKIGAGRGYKGINRSYHLHPSRDKETFSQAHLCLHKYNKDGNVYGWRLTPLMRNVLDNVAWHAGNWGINQRSIGIETAGNYVNQEIDDKACMLIADTFRNHDASIGGTLKIHHHSMYSATACPGRIKEKTGLIVDMINFPQKYSYVIEDQKMIDEIKKQIEQKEQIIAQKDNAYISLTALKESVDSQNKVLTEQNKDLTDRLTAQSAEYESNLFKITSEYDVKINDLTIKVESLTKQTQELLALVESQKKIIDEKEVVITGLNEAIAKFSDSKGAAVLIPHESAFNKLEKILTGTFTWKDKVFHVLKDIVFTLQNTLGGATFMIGGLELSNQLLGQSFSIITSDMPIWAKVIILITLFTLGFNSTKSISKNILTKNNYTVAKALVTDKVPSLKDEAEVLEYHLTREGVLK